MKKIFTAGVLVVVGLSMATIAQAQGKPERLVKQRQAAMTLQGKYFGPLGAMANGKAPYDAKVVARNAGYLDALSHMPWDGFAPSTKDVKSAALPAAFTDTDKFKEAQDQFHGAVTKLVAASKDGNEETVKAAIKGVAKTCGGCHKNFREKK
jgi:cytochrome c556